RPCQMGAADAHTGIQRDLDGAHAVFDEQRFNCASLKQVDAALVLSGLKLHIAVLEQFNGVVAEGAIGSVGCDMSKWPGAAVDFAVLGMHRDWLLALNGIHEVTRAN